MSLGLIGAGLSLAGSLYSSHKAGEEQEKAQEMLQNRIGSIEDAFNLDQSRNFLDSEEASGVMERLRSQLQEVAKRNEKNAIRTNQTNEAQVAAQGDANKAYSRAISDLAVYGDQRKEGSKFRYQNMLSGLYDKEMGVQGAKTQNWMQSGQNWSNIGGSLIDVFDNAGKSE